MVLLVLLTLSGFSEPVVGRGEIVEGGVLCYIQAPFIVIDFPFQILNFLLDRHMDDLNDLSGGKKKRAVVTQVIYPAVISDLMPE